MSEAGSCRICRSDTLGAALSVKEMMFGTREAFDYVTCTTCGTMQIAEVPDDLERHYPAGAYYSFHNQRQEAWHKRLAKRLLARHICGRPERYPSGEGKFETLKRGVQPWIALVPGLGLDSSILDVGCGEAARLHDLASFGFTNLHGVDPFLPEEMAGTGAAGVNLSRCHLSEHHGQHDLVMMHHALEHVPDPAEMLRLAKQRLTKSGHILIRIPVLQREVFDRFGEHWAQIDPPRHLYLMSEKAMRALAQSAGLETVRIAYDTDGWSFAWSEAYRRGISMQQADGTPNSLPFTPAEIARFDREARRHNAEDRGDQACFVLRPTN